jgi:flagellar biogenesis protein FliO
MCGKLPLWLGLAFFVACDSAPSATAEPLLQPRSVATPSTMGDTQVLEPPANNAPGAGIPLAPPRQRQPGELSAPRMPGSTTTTTTVVASLALVLGLFFVLAWFMRRNLPKGMTQLPGEVLEQLGRAPLAGKQQMHLVRLGHKLVLIVVTPFGAETIAEISDPDEVDRICGLCRQGNGHGPSAEFRAILRQFEREPAPPGFLGSAGSQERLTQAVSDNRRKRRWGGLHAEA